MRADGHAGFDGKCKPRETHTLGRTAGLAPARPPEAALLHFPPWDELRSLLASSHCCPQGKAALLPGVPGRLPTLFSSLLLVPKQLLTLSVLPLGAPRTTPGVRLPSRLSPPCPTGAPERTTIPPPSWSPVSSAPALPATLKTLTRGVVGRMVASRTQGH